MIDTVNKFIHIYFTSFPYDYYKKKDQESNFALSGIGLGFIYSQRVFWVSNFILISILYNIKNNDLFYINIFLSFLCIFLYIDTAYSFSQLHPFYSN
jgi:uncharacterized protein YqhQ